MKWFYLILMLGWTALWIADMIIAKGENSAALWACAMVSYLLFAREADREPR